LCIPIDRLMQFDFPECFLFQLRDGAASVATADGCGKRD